MHHPLSPAQQDLVWQKAALKAKELRSQVLPAVEQLERELLLRKLQRLKNFVAHFWSCVEPAKPLAWNWHLDVLCEIIERSVAEPQDYIINVPPGTMKSLLMSVFARAWLWSRDPRLRFLVASYGSHLSVRDNVRLRQILESAEYKRLFPHVQLTEDENLKLRFKTTQEGWSLATSVGGVGTGEHPDYVVIDDPLTAEQAVSEAERETANRWLSQTIGSRGLTRGVRFWLIMQRLHEDDPTGFLLRLGGYKHVCFPMYFEPKRADKLDIRTENNELLWPDLYTKEILAKLELKLGPYGVAGQLQQRPAPEGGGQFKREWLPIVEHAPKDVRRRLRGWDMAGTKGAGDWTVGVKISEDLHGVFYIEDVARDRLDAGGVDALVVRTAELDGQEVAIREEREGGSAGKAVVFSRARMLLGYDYRGEPGGGSKITRAQPLRSQCEAGNVRLVRGPWNEVYVQELCMFPGGSHDDQVDASTCAFNELLKLNQELPEFSYTWGRE